MAAAYGKITSQVGNNMWADGAFLTLLTVFGFGMAKTPSVELYPFIIFAGLITAGATGALIRSLMGRPEYTVPATPLILGGLAGFVVGMAYLIPQANR